GHGSLVLGSNDIGSPNSSGADVANVASAATTLEASPNFVNFETYGPYVFAVDARPSVGGDITGVYGAGRAGGAGVAGTSETGPGLYGESGGSGGVGVEAHNPKGVALAVEGKAKFARSGVLVIKAGKASVGKSLTVGSQGLVLATIQGNVAGVYVQGVTRAANSFTIHLNTKTPKDVAVAWFVLN